MLTDEVDLWLHGLAREDFPSYEQVVTAIDLLADFGPTLGRPLVDHMRNSVIHNLKELRPGSSKRSEIRILFVFDPWRSAVLLVAGDKQGNWRSWYQRNIPLAEVRYQAYLRSRSQEEGSR